MKPQLIVLDGGEGTGKSSHTQALQRHYEEDVVITREPGGSPYAEEIRRLILSPSAKDANAETMFGLFWAARAAHLKEIIRPALEDGKTVICDRFDSSTWAYQICGQEQRQLEELFFAMRKHYLGDIKPVYLILDVPVLVGLQRARTRGGEVTHFDERDVDFHTRVRHGFRDFTRRLICDFKFVDSEQSFDEVGDELIRLIDLVT